MAGSPAPSSSPPPSGWPRTSAGPSSGSSTSAGDPTAAAGDALRRRPHPGRRRSSTGGPSSSTTADERRGDPAGRPGPDRRTRWRAPGSATARRSWSTTTPRACSRPGSGGACGPTASSRSAILDGGYPGLGRPRAATGVERARCRAADRTAFTPRGPAAMRLTTADVRGLLGSPDVTLLDARAPAEYHGYEGNTKRLGHIPGAVNVPVGATTQPGTPAAARRRTSCAPCSTRPT